MNTHKTHPVLSTLCVPSMARLSTSALDFFRRTAVPQMVSSALTQTYFHTIFILAHSIYVITALAHRMFCYKLHLCVALRHLFQLFLAARACRAPDFGASTPFLLRCAPQSQCQHPLATLVTFWFFFLWCKLHVCAASRHLCNSLHPYHPCQPMRALIFLLLYRIIARVILVITALAHSMLFSLFFGTFFSLFFVPKKEKRKYSRPRILHVAFSYVATHSVNTHTAYSLHARSVDTATRSDIILRLAPWPPTAWEQKLSNPCEAPKADKRSALCAAPKETYNLLYKRTPACATRTRDQKTSLGGYYASNTYALDP